METLIAHRIKLHRPMATKSSRIPAAQPSSAETAPWLLRIHQFPPKPTYFRVKIWRRLGRLSVYNCPKGRETHVEFNPLTETLGDATVTPWAPANKIFDDVPHLTRSAMNLTVMQSTDLSLVDIIRKAQNPKPGTPWYAIPQIYNGHAVVDVKIADGRGGSETLHINSRSGKRVK